MKKETGNNLFTFSTPELEVLAQEKRPHYLSASPWPHAVFDDFLPETVAQNILEEFPSPDYPMWLDWKVRDPENQPKKQGIGHASNLELASPIIHNIIFAFNSFPFLNFLENLTAIEQLLPDPYLNGGGIQQVLNGGKLSVHTDFNRIESLGLYRRINILLYLNKDWQPEYNGELELWTPDLDQCAKSISPNFNRLVVFETNKKTFHGHPKPLNLPPNVTRKAVTLYYYTSHAADNKKYDQITDWQNPVRL